jgi:hypothetical protein
MGYPAEELEMYTSYRLLKASILLGAHLRNVTDGAARPRLSQELRQAQERSEMAKMPAQGGAMTGTGDVVMEAKEEGTGSILLTYKIMIEEI